jgi:hypothetical protein
VVSDWLLGSVVEPRLVVFGVESGSSLRCISPVGPARLIEPYGVRLSRDGRLVFVTDIHSHSVVVHQVGPLPQGAQEQSRVVCAGLCRPVDVVEGDGVLLVANLDGNTLTRVPWDEAEVFAGPGVAAGARGQVVRGAGELNAPSALALVPQVGVLVRESEHPDKKPLFMKWLV